MDEQLKNPATLAEAIELISVLNARLSDAEKCAEAERGIENELLRKELAERDARIEKLEALGEELRKKVESAEARAAQIVAGLGVPPVERAEAPAPVKNKQELWDQYHALPIEQRNEFYNKNKQAMIG